jgi:tripartite ATP-independent transporter DctP family solute receptor
MAAKRARASITRREVLRSGAGIAAILAAGRAPVFAQAAPKKLVMAHINAVPESAAVGFDWMAKEVTARSKGSLEMQFFGKTLIPQELEIMNAVKSGNIAIGNPAGAAATIFPEMGAFLVPYLINDYKSAYAMFNGKIGQTLDAQWQGKYKVKVLCFFDYGFRHFWTSKAPIVEPKDLRGKKIRVQQAKIFGDTINGLGGNAVPMPWGEVISAAKSGVIDGGDLPVVNFEALKIYDVSKFCSLTYHNYGPTVNVMNLEIWNGLSADEKTLMLDVSREAQEKIRAATESVDNFEAAKKLLEPRGMTVVEAKVGLFREIAKKKIWPNYKSQYGALWDEIEAFKS